MGYDIEKDDERAVMAYTQWFIGDPSWGRSIVRLLRSDNPYHAINEILDIETDGDDTVDSLLKS